MFVNHLLLSLLRPGAAGPVSAAGQRLIGVDHDSCLIVNVLHDIFHVALRNSDAASGKRLRRAKTVQEDCRTESRRSFLVVTDIQAVLVVINVVDDVLGIAAREVEIGQVLDIHKLIVVEPFARVAGPVSILIDFHVRNRTARIIRNSEGAVEMERRG